MYHLSTISCFVAAVLLLQSATGQNGTETGTLYLDSSQLNDLYNGTAAGLLAEPSATGRASTYTATAIIYTYYPVPAPYLKCWCAFQQFLQCHRYFFQAWANRYCRPFIGIWCCPNTRWCYVFIIYPQRPCWIWAIPKYQSYLAVHEPLDLSVLLAP
ncbi:unnamed protein product [Rotaria sp. Silwood2]|nr:unnamed protein product [Rotaria sp. Silwood2]CAF4004978.1 unnamed protein product [Rotaria sp. Silwood2]